MIKNYNQIKIIQIMKENGILFTFKKSNNKIQFLNDLQFSIMTRYGLQKTDFFNIDFLSLA